MTQKLTKWPLNNSLINQSFFSRPIDDITPADFAKCSVDINNEIIL